MPCQATCHVGFVEFEEVLCGAACASMKGHLNRAKLFGLMEAMHRLRHAEFRQWLWESS
jgi:hypothetical protein